MLQLGQRFYELVRGQGGFHLTIEPQKHPRSKQRWMFDAHYVPAERGPGRDDGEWEYLRLTIHPFDFAVSDWRELGNFGLETQGEEGADPILFHTTIENLLAEESEGACRRVDPGTFRARRGEGYLFHCEFKGVMERDGAEEELSLRDEIAFTEVMLRVPINAADPVVAARAIAASEVGPKEIDGGHVLRHDWRREKDDEAPLDNSHLVVLRTPWRREPG
jgi:hypothetical protein